jgi:hypothetical protein
VIGQVSIQIPEEKGIQCGFSAAERQIAHPTTVPLPLKLGPMKINATYAMRQRIVPVQI